MQPDCSGFGDLGSINGAAAQRQDGVTKAAHGTRDGAAARRGAQGHVWCQEAPRATCWAAHESGAGPRPGVVHLTAGARPLRYCFAVKQQTSIWTVPASLHKTRAMVFASSPLESTHERPACCESRAGFGLLEKGVRVVLYVTRCRPRWTR